MARITLSKRNRGGPWFELTSGTEQRQAVAVAAAAVLLVVAARYGSDTDFSLHRARLDSRRVEGGPEDPL
ncbi:unnamed protein product [Lota lota]